MSQPCLAAEPLNRITTLQDFERFLGDPFANRNPFGFAQAVARDLKAEYPAGAHAALLDRRFHLCAWPAEFGGDFVDFEHTVDLIRLVARRDLNLMCSTLFHLSAATAVWIHGSAAQREEIGTRLGAGEHIGFALSEEDSGSDILNMQTHLERVADGYRLTGRKWLVGGGTRASAFYVAARTGKAGPGAFTGVLIDTPRERAASFFVHPSTPIGGMRGIDFNDIEWNGYPVTADRLVGREGQGLETAFKAQQIVRLLSVAGNLGCADTGLRATISFLLGRKVRGQALIDAPSVRSPLGIACAGLLALDICTRVAGRGIHVLPAHFANWSNVIKWLGFTISEDVLNRAAGLLGARSVLAGGHFGGVFEKVRRDNLVIRFVDTSPYGVLKGVAAHLQALSTVGADQLIARESGGPGTIRGVFSSEPALPEFSPGLLDLFAKGADPVMAAFLRNSASMQGAATRPLAEAIRQTDDGIRKLLSRTQNLLKADPARFGASAENLQLAESYCKLHGAAVCALFWCHRGLEDAVIAATVNYLLGTPDSVANEAAIELVMQRYGAGQLLSTQPVEIAG